MSNRKGTLVVLWNKPNLVGAVPRPESFSIRIALSVNGTETFYSFIFDAIAVKLHHRLHSVKPMPYINFKLTIAKTYSVKHIRILFTLTKINQLLSTTIKQNRFNVLETFTTGPVCRARYVYTFRTSDLTISS